MSASDDFRSMATNLASPAVGAFAIVPHDTNELSYVTRALRIGSTDGNLTVVFLDGTVESFPVQAFEILPFRVKIVKSSTTVDVWGLI